MVTGIGRLALQFYPGVILLLTGLVLMEEPVEKTYDNYPSLDEKTSLIPWTRKQRLGPEGSDIVELHFEIPADKFGCADAQRDILMIVRSDCDTSAFVSDVLLHCQGKTRDHCRRNLPRSSTYGDDSCYITGNAFMRIVHFCVGQDHQYDICSQKEGVHSLNPVALYYKEEGLYQEEKPCVCVVPNKLRFLYIVYSFLPGLRSDSQLHINQQSTTRRTVFDGSNGRAGQEYEGMTVWLSGIKSPQIFIGGLFGREPLQIKCGPRNVGAIARPPTLESSPGSKARLSCFLSRAADSWPLQKFGMVYSAEDAASTTGNTSSSEAQLKTLSNSFYCHRGLVVSSFVAASASSTHRAVNQSAMNEMCQNLIYSGDMTFTMTVTTTDNVRTDTRSRWHCFYEIYDWVQLSSHLDVTFAAKPTDSTRASTGIFYESETTGQPGPQETQEPQRPQIGQGTDALPGWVVPALSAIGSVLGVVCMALIYTAIKRMYGKKSSGFQQVQTNNWMQPMGTEPAVANRILGNNQNGLNQQNTVSGQPVSSVSTPVAMDGGMVANAARFGVSSPQHRAHRRRHSDIPRWQRGGVDQGFPVPQNF